MSILKNYQIVFWPIFEVDADSVGITINRPYCQLLLPKGRGLNGNV